MKHPGRAGTARRPLRWRRWVWRFCAGIAFAVFVFVAIIGVRLLLGPVSIGLAARQAQSILAILAGPEGSAEVGGASLSWRPDQSFVVELTGVSISGPAGAASIPAIVIDVDLDALLLAGRLRAHGLVIESPRVRFAPFGGADMTLPEPIALLDQLDERLARVGQLAMEQGIEQVAIRDGAVRMERPGIQGPLDVSAIEITAKASTGGNVSVAASGVVGQEVWSGEVSRHLSDSGSAIVANVDGISPAALLGGGAIIEGVSLGGRAEVQFSPTGQAVGATISVTAGRGMLSLGGVPDVALDRAEVNLAWRPATGDFALTPSPISIDGLEIVLAGTVLAPTGAEPIWKFQLTVPRATMAPPDVPGPPAIVDSASADGSFDPATLTATIDHFAAAAPQGAVAGAGSVFIGEGGPLLKMKATLTAPVDDATFLKVWPRFVNAPARKWLVDNIRGGILTEGSIDVDLGPEDFDTDPKTKHPGSAPAQVKFVFKDAVVKLPGDIPALSAGVGHGFIDGPVLNVTLDSAQLTPKDGQPVTLQKGSLIVPDLDERPVRNEIVATLSGPAKSLAMVADADPMRAMYHLKINPQTLSGTATADMTMKGPMEDPFDPSKLDWTVRAVLENVSSSAPIDGRMVSKVNVTVDANPAGMTIKGKAVVEGIAAAVDLTQSFKPGAAGAGGVEFVLTEADRKAKGVDLGGLLTGPVAVVLDAKTDGTQDLDVDLTKATVTLPGIGWTKGAGVAARATFQLAPVKGGGFRITDFKATADGVDIAGTLTVDKAGNLVAADFTRFALRPSDSAAITLKRGPRNGYAITINAKRLDGRGFLRQLKTDSGASSKAARAKEPPLDITAKIASLTGYGGVSLDGIDLSLAMEAGRISRMRLAASTRGKGGAISATVDPDGNARALVLTAGDTGRLLKFVDLYGQMSGGDGRLTASLTQDGAEGALSVKSFRITEDPKLARLLVSSSDRVAKSAGKQAPVAAPPATASSFDRLVVRFDLTGDSLKITDAVLRGPASGGSAAGTIQLDKGTMALTGTFIPIYALNNLFGRIPVIGEILGGGSDGGLFGVTFRLDGPIADPALTFNPISTITPGIFRRIFEFQ